MKIIVYGICKNEYNNVERFMETGKAADGVYLCDTGSTDGTQEFLRQKGAVVNDIMVCPWRFDLARNMALLKVPDDADVCISLDLDEILLDGWREEIENIWEEGTIILRYPYVFNWEDDAQTIPRLKFYNFKIHSRNGFSWCYPIHEILESMAGKEKEIYTDKIICHHHPDVEKERNYQNLLDLAVKEYPECQRMSHLRGRELMMFGRHKEAIEELKRHLTLTDPLTKDYGGVAQTRSMSMRYIGRCLKMINEHPNEILEWFLRANAECPYTRESWIWLAQAWLDVGNYIQVFACCKTGLAITDQRLSIECEGGCWGEYPERLMNKAKLLMEE